MASSLVALLCFIVVRLVVVSLGSAQSNASQSSSSTAVKKFSLDYPVFSSGGGLVNTWEPQVTVTNNGNVYIFATNLNGVTACLDCGSDPIIYRKLKIESDGEFNWLPIKGAASPGDDYYNDDFSDSFVSVNDGNNFAYINPGPLIWFADIVVVPDSNNNLYATYIGFSGQPWNILFQKSTDNGLSWSTPVSVSANYSADKNWIAVDASSPNYLYVTFNSQWPVATSSVDGGETWAKPQILDSTLHGRYVIASLISLSLCFLLSQLICYDLFLFFNYYHTTIYIMQLLLRRRLCSHV